MTARIISLRCDNVTESDGYCNKYGEVLVSDMNKTVSTIVNESSWEYDPETDKTYCEEHQ